MGIIKKQAISGNVIIYMGAILGFVSVSLIMPNILTAEEIGLLNILVAYSVIFAQFGNLGLRNITTRLFTYFRNYKKNHNGFLFLALVVSLIGFILVITIFFILKPFLVEQGGNKAPLFAENVFYILPIIFFVIFFMMFDNYYKVLYNAVFGTMVKEVVQRILILISLVVFFLHIINYNELVLFYVISLCLPAVILVFKLISIKQFNLKPQLSFVSKNLAKSMMSVGLWGIISGATGIIILNIDRIMIKDMIDLGATGIYTTTFYFGSLIIMPSRAVTRISSVIIADLWKVKDVKLINVVYFKSSLNQFIIGSLLLIGILANIDNIFSILPEEFQAGKLVILFISFAFLFDMISGVSGSIIQNSSNYKVHTYLMIVLVILVICTNYYFIPKYGIVGAAIASALSKLIFNVLKYLFLYVKYKMQPYNSKFVVIALIAGVSFFAGYIIPEIEMLVADILIRSTVITIIFGGLILIFKISEDMDNSFKSLVNSIRNIGKR